MKVVHVISGLNVGGAERFVLELCRHSMLHKDVMMSVVSLSAASRIDDTFNRSGVRLLNTTSSSRKSKAFSGFRTLLREKPDIIHAHMFHACIVACAAKLFLSKTKVVFTLHNNYVFQWHRKLLLFLTRWLRSADIVFPGLSLKWYQKSNAVCIPNGIDIRRFTKVYPQKPPVFTCAYVGRLNKEKNPLFLVELAKSLVAEHNFIIRIAGEGPLKHQLTSSIKKNDVEEYFSIEGYVEDVPALLAQSHCLLLPSLWEGMPLAVLEAGAAGVPVIATPVGNIPTLMNKSNGFVTQLAGFRQVLEQVMNNYGDALITARNFMHTVHEQYNMSECYQRHVSVYLQK